MNIKKFGPYLVFFAAMLWATDAPFRLHLTQGFSSNFIVLGEHTVDTIVVLPILFLNFTLVKQLQWREWLAIAVIAIGGSALASIAFTEAFHYVNPSVAILLQKLQPLIAITLAAALLKEQLNSKFWLWTAAALFGAYLISFPGLVPKSFPGETFNPNLQGVGLALLAAALWGSSTVLGKYVLNKTNFKIMTSLRFVVAFAFLLILNLWQKTLPSMHQITPKDALYFVIIAIASGVVSLFIYYKGLQNTTASVATLAELGFPMAAVIVNWIFLKDVLAPMQIVGMAVLLFAVFFLARENTRTEELVALEPAVK